MSTLFAQPYNIDATGFYFDNVEDYQTKAEALRDIHGNPVEEFEIQMIDAEYIDCDLFEALCVCQVNIEQFFDAVDNWQEDEKLRVIIAVGECGYTFEDSSTPDSFEVDIYEIDSLKELAEHFVEGRLIRKYPRHYPHVSGYERNRQRFRYGLHRNHYCRKAHHLPLRLILWFRPSGMKAGTLTIEQTPHTKPKEK